MTEAGSIVVRRQLGRELRTWRERSRRTLDDVAAAQVASVSKVQRIEHGRTSVRPGDVRELCRLYGVNDETTQALADMARATRDPDWWERLADPDEDLVERYVSTRMLRQQNLFERADPIRLRIVLGEGALLTQVGSEELMAEQRTHLAAVSGRGHADVRVLQFAVGLHSGLRGSFSVLSFPEPDDPPVVYVETYEAARYPEAPAQVTRYRRPFEQLWALATPIEEYVR